MPRYGHITTTAIGGGAALAALLLMMLLTNPVMIGPLGVTAWFLIAFIAVSSLATLVAFYLSKRFESHASEHQLVVSSRRRGIMVGLFVSVMLGLQSLQQFNLRDAILLLLLMVLTEFYLVTKS